MNAEKPTIFDQYESRIRSYSRSFPTTFDRARGAELWDTNGRRYLDFLSGCGSLNYGHNNPVLKAALVDYITNDSIAHSMDMQTTAKEQLLEAISECILAPRQLDYVAQFTGPTGTNAVEAALKLARKISGRQNVIFFTNGFHGVSMGALAITGNRFNRNAARMPLAGSTVAPYDGYLGAGVDTIEYLEKLLDDPSSGLDEPAAIIVEAVQGEGGITTARLDWLRRLQTVCRQRSILLILDEIQTGCGRTGTFFSFEAAGIEPDLITLAKSISGFGLPMAMVLIRRELDVWSPGEHNGTFRGNNHAFVTAAAALRHYWSDDRFTTSIGKLSKQLDELLVQTAERFAPHIAQVRGRAMMRGLVLADPQAAARVSATVFTNGLVMERSGPNDEVLKFLTPLTITAEQLTEGMQIIDQALAREFATGARHTVGAKQEKVSL